MTGMNGASVEIRTPDLLFTRQLLYQLSYAGTKQHYSKTVLNTKTRQGFFLSKTSRIE